MISPNTKAILLLTAPLVAGRGAAPADVLTHGEYKRLARLLRDQEREPSDLLAVDAMALLETLGVLFDRTRLQSLLGRGFRLAEAAERWQSRGIWVISRADREYPRRFKTRLKDDSPPVLYGCGEMTLLETGGLAVVGSRHVDAWLGRYAENVGRLAAGAGRTVVSGGARGIDRAAMSGALAGGGKAVGIIADNLERAAVNRENRGYLMENQLTLVTPYDPAAGFNVGHAMQRNKLIYALADVALVVNAELGKGGTWTGAIEQLDVMRTVPVFVRAAGETGAGLQALLEKGAAAWPEPGTPDALMEALESALPPRKESLSEQLSFPTVRESRPPAYGAAPAEELFEKVRALLRRMSGSKTEEEVAGEWAVSTIQAGEWLERLVREGVLRKVENPTRYLAVAASAPTIG